jgi:cytohesin
MVKFLLAKGANPNATGESGRTPLHEAAWGKRPLVEALLAHGANVNAKDDHGVTPLHQAARFYSETVEYLLKNGADVNARTDHGSTPLKWALEDAHKNPRTGEPENAGVPELLRKHGAVE